MGFLNLRNQHPASWRSLNLWNGHLTIPKRSLWIAWQWFLKKKHPPTCLASLNSVNLDDLEDPLLRWVGGDHQSVVGGGNIFGPIYFWGCWKFVNWVKVDEMKKLKKKMIIICFVEDFFRWHYILWGFEFKLEAKRKTMLTLSTLGDFHPAFILTWNPKHPFLWMIPNLYFENGCFTISIHLKLVVWGNRRHQDASSGGNKQKIWSLDVRQWNQAYYTWNWSSEDFRKFWLMRLSLEVQGYQNDSPQFWDD